MFSFRRNYITTYVVLMYETAITSEDNELLGFTINVVQKQRQ